MLGMTRAPLQRQAAGLVVTRHPERLWALDRLLPLPETPAHNPERKVPVAAISTHEALALAYELLRLVVRASLARAKFRFRKSPKSTPQSVQVSRFHFAPVARLITLGYWNGVDLPPDVRRREP